jgi:adenylate cyclase class 2
MKTEFEAKFLKIEKDEIRQKLKALGAEMVFSERKFRRITFDNPELRSKNAWIRLRDEGDKVTLALKSVSDPSSISGMKESSFEVKAFEEVIVFLEALGFNRKGYEENYREEWKLGNIVFDIDTWPLIDPWLEIEAPTEEEVKQYFEVLGLNFNEAVFGSADIVYRDFYGIEILGRPTLLFN